MQSLRRQLLIAAGLAGLAGRAHAQTTLPGNATIISGFPAGGMGDVVSRPMAERLRGRYAANLIVDFKLGAGGRIAAEYVKRAAPDGLTILQIPSSIMVLYPHIYKKLAYDPLTDFVPVTSTAAYEVSFTAGPGLPADVRSVADYVRWARANPRQANYGVPAAGSALHFAGMMLQRAASFEFTAVPYKGGAPLLQDLLGGQIPVGFNVLGEALPHIRAGKLRSLGVVNDRRSAFLPDVPTLGEQGFRELVLHEWLGWYLPAKTPPEIVRRLNALLRESLSTPEVVEGFAARGLVPQHQSVEECAALVRGELERWGGIVRATGFTPED